MSIVVLSSELLVDWSSLLTSQLLVKREKRVTYHQDYLGFRLPELKMHEERGTRASFFQPTVDWSVLLLTT